MVKPDDVFMRDVLVDARRRAGLTQAELAARLRVHLTTLSAWEQGRSAPRGDNRRRVAAFVRSAPREKATA